MAERADGIIDEKSKDPGSEGSSLMDAAGGSLTAGERLSGISALAVGDEPEIEEMRDSIAATRQQMSGTIDAIQERLSYANISEQIKAGVSEQVSEAYESAKNTIYHATVEKAGEFMKKVGQEIKDSGLIPASGKQVLPYALIGVGVGLLFMSSRKKNPASKHRSVGQGRSDHESAGGGSDESALTTAQNKVSDTAGRAYLNVSEKASSAFRLVSGTSHEVYERAGELSSKGLDAYRHFSTENPLAIGAAALALGAVVGWAIPITHYEGELLGETRDNLIAKAGETARETLQKVQEVGEQAANAIGEGTGN